MRELCTKCNLCLNINNQLKGENKGIPNMVFLYNHPSTTQDKYNSIFVGNHFKRLEVILKSHNLYDLSYHTHIIKCKPLYSESYNFERLELRNHRCSSYHFAKEFKDIKDDVKIIIPVGKFAYQFITSNSFIHSSDYKLCLKHPIKINNLIIYPIDTIGILIKDNELESTIKALHDYYAREFNPRLLLIK